MHDEGSAISGAKMIMIYNGSQKFYGISLHILYFFITGIHTSQYGDSVAKSSNVS